MNFSGFDPSKTGKEIGTAGSNLACAFNKEREIEQCIYTGNYKVAIINNVFIMIKLSLL